MKWLHRIWRGRNVVSPCLNIGPWAVTNGADDFYEHVRFSLPSGATLSFRSLAYNAAELFPAMVRVHSICCGADLMRGSILGSSACTDCSGEVDLANRGDTVVTMNAVSNFLEYVVDPWLVYSGVTDPYERLVLLNELNVAVAEVSELQLTAGLLIEPFVRSVATF